jgi:hypothetical protein
MPSDKYRAVGPLVLLVFCLSQAEAALVGDLPGWSGTRDFSWVRQDRTLAGTIEYAVYNHDSYEGAGPGGGDYIYAYQIFSSGSSTVGVEFFSVGVLEDTHVGQIDSDSSLGSGWVKPFCEYFSPSADAPQSANFLFLPGLPGLVQRGQYSAILLFTSDNLPTWGFGTVAGGGLGGTIEQLPTPVPEPGTVVFLATGLVAVLARTRPGCLRRLRE